ncbi:hypothetical protein C8T65DRAFT_831723 [Cerioporus squamosus]|nr:hypothetical protein C8T65DRAFT_831723 [Cerioporus squamosus]
MSILEYAHVLPAATSDSVLDRLEWAWNMPHRTLNVDTRKNVHPLLHRYFDRTDNNKHNGWFWFPADDADIILDMQVFYVGRDTMPVATAGPSYPNVRRKPDEFYHNAKSFKYQLVPFPAMKSTWTVRKPIRFDVPVISLHVPCHFVICDTAKKLVSFSEGVRPTFSQLVRDFPSLTKTLQRFTLLAVWDIYDAWMCARPDGEWMSTAGQLTTGGPGGGGHDGPGGPSSHSGGHHDPGGPSSHGGGHDGPGGPSSYGGGHDGPGSSHGGNEGGGGQDLPNENDGPPQGASGAGDHAFVQSISSLAPEDSASCCDVAPGKEESGEEAPEDEDSDDQEEWDDFEYSAWLEAWAEDVWEAMQEDASPPLCAQKAPSPSPSQETLVDVPASRLQVL